MALQQDILNLLLKLKDKNLSAKDKSKIKAQLKKLYSKIKRISSKRVKITSPFKEEVKDILNPLKQSIMEKNLTEKQKIKQFEKSVKNEIKELKELKEETVDPQEIKRIEDQILEKKSDILSIKEIEGKEPVEEAIQILKAGKNISSLEELDMFATQVFKNVVSKNPNSPESEIKRLVNMKLTNPVKRIMGVNKHKSNLNKLFNATKKSVKKEIEAEEARQQELEQKEPEEEDFFSENEPFGEEDEDPDYLASYDPQFIGEGKKKSNYNYMGRKAKKMRGGAGIADWALTLGSIPGIPQLMNNFGPFGQVLGQASGLAQTFGKTAGQLAKEASKEGEKVAGFTDSLGGIKSMFGFGQQKKKRGGKANMADMSGGAFSDFLGTIGAITPKIGGIVGAVPTYGKVATIGNSVLGSASRVGEDIFKMLGLGNMDTTLSGFGNMDLSTQKGYGKKKGGRKMLPLGRPMPTRSGYYTRAMPMDDMAYIQPYGLQAEYPQMLEGGYGLTDMLLDTTGDLIKGSVKGLANAGIALGKDLAKKGVQELANKAVKSIGEGKKKKIKGGYLTSLFNIMGKGKKEKMKGGFLPLLAMMGMGNNMRGCGKINGEYVSSEFEDEYERNLAHILNQKQMSVLQGERQLEQQIQQKMNVEQQNALAQLQYYDLLNKIQQVRPQI